MSFHIQDKSLSYRPDIDGLRAIAILLVVAFHVGLPGFEAGFVGVDIFFVISGFLITGLLLDELRRSDKIDFIGFYCRRVRRLLPAIVAVLIVVSILGLLFLHPYGQQQRLAKSVIASALFVANIYFSITTGGYFETHESDIPLLHFWSLAVEEQFYALWPLTLIFVTALSRRFRVAMPKAVSITIAILALASLTYLFIGLGASSSEAYYSTLARAWQLMAGGFLAVTLTPGRIAALRAYEGPLYAAGAVLLISSLIIIDGPGQYPSWNAVLPTVGCMLFICGGSTDLRSRFGNLLACPPLVNIGKVSFSWYLWHWPLISIAQSYALGTHSVVRNVIVALLALGLATLTYHWIEKPFRSARISTGYQRAGVLSFGAASTVVVIFTAGAAGWVARHAEDLQPWLQIDQRLQRVRYDRPEAQQHCHYDSPFFSMKQRDLCIAGSRANGIRAVLWGDSHANHLYPLVSAFGERNNIGVLQRSFSGCRPMLGGYDYRPENTIDDCKRFHADVLNELAALKEEGLEGVIVSGYWAGDFEKLWVSTESRSLVKAYLLKTVTEIADLGLRVLIVTPVPDFHFHPLDCLARNPGLVCKISYGDWLERTRVARSVLVDVAVSIKNVRTLSLASFFCDKQYCYVERDRTVLYRDKNHITVEAAKNLLSLAEPELSWVSGLTRKSATAEIDVD